MLIPDEKMLRFLAWERGVFLHFGIRTFNEGRKDWDYVPMPLNTFQPTALDCGQWAATIAEAGFSYAVMTAKHHDGFCLWPTDHSDYSIRHCPWREGKGDVVREYLDAMREQGIRTGLYYSPADQVVFSQKLSMAEHNRIIENHLLELCTRYGKIDYLWFDNCGSDKCVYEWDRFSEAIIRKHQPNAVVNSNGDVHSCWVGNEAGYAPYPCRYIHDIEAYGRQRVSNRLLRRVRNGRFWSPSEADCMLDEGSWFYRDDRELRSLDVLMGIYELSVGRGINLLLNVAPDRHGLLPEPDRTRLLEFGTAIRRRFAHPIARLSDATRADNHFRIVLPEPVPVTHVTVREGIDNGARIRRFRICAQPYLHAREPIVLYNGQGVGHRAICSFPTVCCREIDLHVLESDGPYTLTALNVHASPHTGKEPVP